jgi:hypothetical protein
LNRKTEPKAGTLFYCRIDPDRSSQALYDHPADGESQPRALNEGVQFDKTFKDFFSFIGGNADA